jgi:hypothetical protein
MKARKRKGFFIHYLPVFGCFSTGLIYVAIGVIAILSFLRLKQGGADEGSLIAFLNDFLVGRIFIWIILSGSISYIIWRIYESLKDPYHYGTAAKGIALRTGIALSTIADALIAYSAILVLFGNTAIPENGQPRKQRQVAGSMLQESWGDWVLMAIGFIIIATALIQLVYGVAKGYGERMNASQYRPGARKTVYVLAVAGYIARGIILGIIGFFFIKAGLREKAYYIVNTDKAFDFIGDHVGHVYFILVAIGTICYGLFMFALGMAYNTGKD